MYRLKSHLHRLLRWSERYTKTDMVYLARGGFWSAVGQTSAILTTLALALVVGRFLPKEIYGEYKYIVSIVALLSTFSLTGLGQAVFQSVTRGFDGALEEGFWVNLRWSIGIFLGALALALYYFAVHNTTLALGILIGGSLSPLLTSANLSSAFLGAKKDFARQAIYFDIIENLIPVTALIATIFILPNTLTIVAVYFISNTLVTLWLYRRTIRVYKPDTRQADSGTLTYAKHLSLMGIFSGIASNIDQILLFHFTGAAPVGVYNFATAVPDQAKGPLKTLDTMTQARFAAREATDIHASIHNKMFWIFVSTALGVIIYLAAAPYLFALLFPRYVEAVSYSQIYALSLFAATVSPAASYLSVKKKVKHLYVNTIVSALLQIVLLTLGVIVSGLLGLIIARVLIRLGGALVTLVLYYHAIRSDTLASV